MNKKEKLKLARQILRRNSYTEKEIKKILGYAFDSKKAKGKTESKND